MPHVHGDESHGCFCGRTESLRARTASVSWQLNVKVTNISTNGFDLLTYLGTLVECDADSLVGCRRTETAISPLA